LIMLNQYNAGKRPSKLFVGLYTAYGSAITLTEFNAERYPQNSPGCPGIRLIQRLAMPEGHTPLF
jgi:hypothetical protein